MFSLCMEDQEVNLDEVIQGALPPVPLDISYTAHWLAVDGVQPAIVQNPSPADLKQAASEAGQMTQLRAASATDVILSGSNGTLNGELLVKNTLSKELQLYHDKITESILAASDEQRNLAVESVMKDPGIQPLLPYFVQFITDKVTKNVRSLPLLWSMMRMTRAILSNPNLFVDPYLHQLVPVVITCMVSKKIGDTRDDHYALRKFSADVSSHICEKFGLKYPTLQPRIAKTLLRAFLDPLRTNSTRYGAITGLAALGQEAVQLLVFPNIKAVGEASLAKEMVTYGEFRTQDAQHCFNVIVVRNS
ncbi:hypothetical protein HK101_000259 [Irineochytrium annulatum]|nr:hypothetical protein HK101_000259 [Irineochytrium annulatum]